MLRLKGRNVEENPHVKMGAYHTIDLELHKKFTLQKPLWDSVHLERIELATDPGRSADVAALIMAEGTALVVSIGSVNKILYILFLSVFGDKLYDSDQGQGGGIHSEEEERGLQSAREGPK